MSDKKKPMVVAYNIPDEVLDLFNKPQAETAEQYEADRKARVNALLNLGRDWRNG